MGRNTSDPNPPALAFYRVAMLLLSLATRFLAAINSYAKPTARAVGSLDVSLSTPTDKIESASDLKIVATVKNTGNEDLRILKYRTVLDDERPTRSFVVRKDGKEVYFAGAEVCTPPSPPPALSINMTDGPDSFPPPRTALSRVTGLSSVPASI